MTEHTPSRFTLLPDAADQDGVQADQYQYAGYVRITLPECALTWLRKQMAGIKHEALISKNQMLRMRGADDTLYVAALAGTEDRIRLANTVLDALDR